MGSNSYAGEEPSNSVVSPHVQALLGICSSASGAPCALLPCVTCVAGLCRDGHLCCCGSRGLFRPAPRQLCPQLAAETRVLTKHETSSQSRSRESAKVVYLQ